MNNRKIKRKIPQTLKASGTSHVLKVFDSTDKEQEVIFKMLSFKIFYIANRIKRLNFLDILMCVSIWLILVTLIYYVLVSIHSKGMNPKSSYRKLETSHPAFIFGNVILIILIYIIVIIKLIKGHLNQGGYICVYPRNIKSRFPYKEQEKQLRIWVLY